MENKMLLSITEAAKVLGISRPTLYRLMHTADLPTIRLSGRVLVPIKQLDEWLDRQIPKEQEVK